MIIFFKILLAVLAVLIIAMFINGKYYHYEKSIVINAPLEQVYANASSMKLPLWFPTKKLRLKCFLKNLLKAMQLQTLFLRLRGNSTKVTWTMDCELDYPMNLMKFFMDSQMEKSYGSGLQKLKVLAEK